MEPAKKLEEAKTTVDLTGTNKVELPNQKAIVSTLGLGRLGEALIKGYEKCVLAAYKDSAGVPTIGWGNTFYEDGTRVRMGDTITRERADALFNFTMKKTFLPFVQKRIKVPLTQNEFDALVSFTYNTGGQYTGSNGKRVDYNIYVNVNNRMAGDSLYNYWTTLAITSGGQKLKGLMRRRKSEVTLFQNNVVNFFE